MSETQKDKVLYSSKVKSVFNNQTLPVRELGEKQSSIMPNVQGLASTNWPFILDDFTLGLERRVMFYNVKFQFCKESQYDSLKTINKFVKVGNDKCEHMHKDPALRSAMLSLLSFMNSLIYKKYDTSMENINSSTIDKETQHEFERQNHVAKFINTRIVRMPPECKDESKYRMKLADVAMIYYTWYDKNVKSMRSHNISAVCDRLTESILRTSIVTDEKTKDQYLDKHRVLNLSELVPAPDEELIGFSNSKMKESTLDKFKNKTSKEILNLLWADFNDE
jgi:phage/plasmid-associated DNA primase